MKMVNVNLNGDYDEEDKFICREHGTKKKFPDRSRTHGLQDTGWAL